MNTEEIEYANFGTRIGAVIIDAILIIIALSFIIPSTFMLIQKFRTSGEELSTGTTIGLVLMYFFGIPILGLLYRALFECSTLQGTPGKAIVGIKVVNSNYKRISLMTSILRNFVKIFSGMAFYIGYLVALRDKKCLTWHDMAAGTFVIRK